MSHSPRSWTRIVLTFALASAVTSVLVVGATEVGASAATPTNTPPTAAGLGKCKMTSSTITVACLKGALTDFDRARAKEHLGAMTLPSNFRSMTVPQQMFTLTNIDRRSRKIATFASTSPNLNPYTQSAANAVRDPYFPSWNKEGGSNWAGVKNALWAEYLWMYDDGPGSANGSCPSIPSTCWIHRDNILRAYGAPRIFNASVGSQGIASLMLGLDTHDWYPNPPRSLKAQELTGRRLLVSWAAPAANGPAIGGYYFRRDGGAWVKTTARSWTTAALRTGTHTLSVKAYNARGSSPVATIRVTVR